MDDTVATILLLIGGMVGWIIGHHRYRRWKVGKLADKMLEDVIKGKDAFRR
jgi:membrane protein YqaA with SNARE-associated domain